MKKTIVHIEPNPLITYDRDFLFLGSCFSEHLSKKMQNSGFTVSANPFGVVFNPLSLADFFLFSPEQLSNTVFYREDVALSWLANSTCFEYNDELLKENLIQQQSDFLTKLKQAKVLFITFGTAWTYFHKESNVIVANCHKFPSENFEKQLISVDEIYKKWEETIRYIIAQNKEIEVVFTVSPVRHLKDGLVQNTLSKSILIHAVHKLLHQFSNTHYFPAYELMQDELRDYAYYSTDGVHPNETAISEIWERFRTTFFTKDTFTIYDEVEKIKSLFHHRPIHPNSSVAKQFEQDKQDKINQFKEKYPTICIEEIL